MRTPIAHGFYPFNEEGLKQIVDELLDKVTVSQKNIIAGVVPHAGYAYSGKTAAYVYKSLRKNYGSVVLLGPNHTHLGKKVAVSLEDWETPLGTVENDKKLGEKIISNSSLIDHDELPHLYEHSLEVQLPFLQRTLEDIKIVPISISVSCFNLKSTLEIGQAIKKAIGQDKVLILASSDFTHYGRTYDFAPVKSDQNQWVKKTDRAIIDAIVNNNAERVIELASKTTVCGYGAIVALMFALKEPKAKLLHYSTSYDILKNTDAIVGYAGIVFE